MEWKDDRASGLNGTPPDVEATTSPTDLTSSGQAAIHGLGVAAFMAVTWGVTFWMVAHMVAQIVAVNGNSAGGVWNGLF